MLKIYNNELIINENHISCGTLKLFSINRYFDKPILSLNMSIRSDLSVECLLSCLMEAFIKTWTSIVWFTCSKRISSFGFRSLQIVQTEKNWKQFILITLCCCQCRNSESNSSWKWWMIDTTLKAEMLIFNRLVSEYCELTLKRHIKTSP